MPWYVVTYEIRTTDDPKKVMRLEEELRKNSDWCMPTLSHWIIKNDNTPEQIIDHLIKVNLIAKGDGIFIFETTLNGSFRQASRHATEWLQAKLKSA